jgi:hypothetical protein
LDGARNEVLIDNWDMSIKEAPNIPQTAPALALGVGIHAGIRPVFLLKKTGITGDKVRRQPQVTLDADDRLQRHDAAREARGLGREDDGFGVLVGGRRLFGDAAARRLPRCEMVYG